MSSPGVSPAVAAGTQPTASARITTGAAFPRVARTAFARSRALSARRAMRASPHPGDARRSQFPSPWAPSALTARPRGRSLIAAAKKNKEAERLERELEQARREAREAEELFAAAADERAAKVKELVSEIDHWHDAATLAQQMEQDARRELEDARRQLDENGGRAHDAHRELEEARKRADEADHYKREAEERADAARRDAEGAQSELDGLRGELDGLRGELDGVRGELERARQHGDAEGLKHEVEALKRKHEEDKAKWKRAAAAAEESIMKTKDGALEEMQRKLREAESARHEAVEGRKRADESVRLFSEQHGAKVKELEARAAELQDQVEKKEWYLGERTADLERAREELERASEPLERAEKEAELANAKVKERDSELELMKAELAEARSMLDALADGADAATAEATARVRDADEKLREAAEKKAETEEKLERTARELQEVAEDSAAKLREATARVDEAWAAAEEKNAELDRVREKLDEMRRDQTSASERSSLRVHQAEHRAGELRAAVEEKERAIGRLRTELAAAREQALTGAGVNADATQRALRAEERAAACADEARAAAVAAERKLERTKSLAEEANEPAEQARAALERLHDLEGQVEGADRDAREKAEELRVAREDLANKRAEAVEQTRRAAADAEAANERLGQAEMRAHRSEQELARIERDLDSIEREIQRARDGDDHDTVARLEAHRGDGFAARDRKREEIEGLKRERDELAAAARDAAQSVTSRVNESHGVVSHAKARVQELALEHVDLKQRLERVRSGCSENAAAHAEAARLAMRAEQESFASAREAAEAANAVVEKMRASEEAHQAAYDAAAHRERTLRDEAQKAESEAQSHGGFRSGDVDMADVRRRVDDAKRTAEWAADLEGQRKAAERVVEESKERLREAEEMRSEALRGAEEAEREFGRMSEQLEQTRRAAAAAAEVEEQRRVAAVAAVDASHALRLAQERVGEMTGKMNKKEREFVDVEADIAAAEREAEAATRESEAAKEEERRLARDGDGGGGGGGGASELERKKEELSWMRGQLEEAQHTVMRANELEQQRRAAADAFESAARSVARVDSSSSGRGAPAPDPRGVPTAEQLAGREAELAGMRRELDELDRSGRALSEHVNEMRRVMAGEASDPRGVPTREQLETRVAELDAARRRMEEGKSAVARLESHVGEMREVMAAAAAGGAEPTGSEGSQTHRGYGSSGGGEGSASTEADRRAAQLALEEAQYVSREANRRADEIRAAYEEKSRAMETLRADVERGSQLGDRSSADSSEERRRRALVVAAESSYKARQAEERASGLRSQRDERRRELEWMRGEIANAERGIEPLRRAAEDTAEREREMDAKAARLAEEARRSGASGGGAERDPASSPAFASSSRHPVDDYKTREAREAVEKAENDLRWHRGELDAKTEEARKAAAERDSQIESLEFTLSGVEITTSPETRYNAEDTATASFRIRQIEERADRLESERAESDGAGSRSAEALREEVEHARQAAMSTASAAEQSREKHGRAKDMAAEAASALEAAAAKVKVAEETAEETRVAALAAAARREKSLEEELAHAVEAIKERNDAIERLENLANDLEMRSREAGFEHRVQLLQMTQRREDAEFAAEIAAAEAQTTSRRLESALKRAERELAAMEEAMLNELTNSEVRLMETEETAGSRAEQLEKMRRELLVEREKANLALNEAKIQEARALSSQAEAETALAWQDGKGQERSMLNNEEVEELRAKVDELEVTLAEVMTHGPESTVGDRATGKLMQHIQTLQEKVREGREIKAMSETMLAEQALLREQAEEAKFYMAEAEAKAKEYEELSAKLWGHLDRAGIDVEANVARPTPRQRPKFVSGLTITQGDGMLDPEVEAIQRKLLEADEDLSELMNEIMTEMVLVETAEARRELASAKAEAEELRRRLAERGG